MSKILIIDDSRMVRQQVIRALVPAGFTVIEAEDGQVALDQLAASPDMALVLCDLNMPVMSGLEFLERLADRQPRPSVPVIMLTTEGEPRLIQRAKALGAKGWVVKPFNPEMLVATARKFTANAA